MLHELRATLWQRALLRRAGRLLPEALAEQRNALRHTAPTLLMTQGVPVKIVSETVGLGDIKDYTQAERDDAD